MSPYLLDDTLEKFVAAPRILKSILSLSLTLCISAALSLSAVQAQETPCEDGFRLFDHEQLATDPVCIPEDAQRIVALDNAAVELLLFTDKEIVAAFGAFTIDELSASLPVLAEKLETVQPLEWPVNLELLLELKPDLIVAYDNETMPYDQLSAIAPTVILSAGIAQGNWKEATQFWSDVFNVQDLYAEMLETYNVRVAELQAALGEDRGETEVSLVLASSYFNMIMLADSPTGAVLADVGLGRPASQALNSEDAMTAYQNATFAYLSDETLNLADGDVIYVFTFPVLGEEAVAASDQYLADFQTNPLWQSLSGVQSGQAHVVGFPWTRGNTYLLANAILDDLFATLTDTEATTPNPIVAFEEAAPLATPEATEAAN